MLCIRPQLPSNKDRKTMNYSCIIKIINLWFYFSAIFIIFAFYCLGYISACSEFHSLFYFFFFFENTVTFKIFISFVFLFTSFCRDKLCCIFLCFIIVVVLRLQCCQMTMKPFHYTFCISTG